VGDDVALFVDSNGAFSVREAIEWAGIYRHEYGVSWFEEPVSSDDLEGLDAVRHEVRADVAAGEYGYDAAYLARMAPYVDCLQLDVTRCGGYTGWRRAVGFRQGRHCRHTARRT